MSKQQILKRLAQLIFDIGVQNAKCNLLVLIFTFSTIISFSVLVCSIVQLSLTFTKLDEGFQRGISVILIIFSLIAFTMDLSSSKKNVFKDAEIRGSKQLASLRSKYYEIQETNDVDELKKHLKFIEKSEGDAFIKDQLLVLLNYRIFRIKKSYVKSTSIFDLEIFEKHEGIM
ncbi:hypothetical protein [Paenibacillus polymyxa]|uniref:hypothetical protein n=1 Tax=Paenibacillus polymyxa TaxID=1406 RepID=UPI00177E1FE3|nr:hypothetical protein [Paenibacillus polymyxa]QOH62386.1 hypothetical protein DI243_13770 [Paenibacillus polymyxa]